MAVTTTNLGVITAYGDAVAAGYTGTKAEWQALMASYATVGQQAVDAKNAAVAAKDTAVAKATEATTAANTATTKANEASASAKSIAQSAAQIQENTDDISQLKSDLNNTLSQTRNIFDPSGLLQADGWTESNEEYQGTGTAINAKYGMNGVNYPLDVTLDENTSYTISLLAKTNGNAGTSETGLLIYLMYADGTNGSISIPNSTTTFTNFKLTSNSSKTLVGIRISYATRGDNIWHFKNIQLEKGAFQTEYIKDKVSNDQLARENISALKTALMTNYANAVIRTVASNATIHISDVSKLKTSPLVSVRSTNLLDPICKKYLYFEGGAGSYSIVSTGGKRANIVDVSNIDVLTISGDLSGFAGSLFRYAFTAEYPSAGVSTALGNGAVNTGTTIAVPNGAQYLIWITGTTSVDTITSNAMLNAGTEALAYTAYIADLPLVSVTIDDDGNGGNAQTHYANSNGDVVGFIVSNEFYAYSQSGVTIFITYVVDTEKAINEGVGGNGYTNLVGDGDTFSMTIGTDQSGALDNSRNIAIGNKNMKNATAIKCMTVGVENMGNVSGEQNTSFGYHSLFRVTSGKMNVAMGNESLDDAMTGNQNAAFGAYAGQRIVQGSGNTAVGYCALKGGYDSYNQASSYNYNTAVGWNALNKCKTNYSNTAIGANAGKTVETGNNNIFVGAGTDATASNISGSIAIGAQTDKSDQMVLGGTGITEVVMCGNKKIKFNQDGTVTWETLT